LAANKAAVSLEERKKGKGMKDDQASEENLMGELDRMYRTVADIEGVQAQADRHNDPNEPEQMSGQGTSTHAKIIPFPGHRIHSPSAEPPDPSGEESSQKSRPFYRVYLIGVSLPLIFLVFVLVVIPLKGMMATPGSEKGEPRQLTPRVYSTPSPPVQTDEDVLQSIKEKQHKAATMPHQTLGANSLSVGEKHYAVQVGAFRDWENASQRIDALRNKDLDPYWIEIKGKSRRIHYIVFSGYFADRNEAADFLKHNGFLNNYPDSYVREISSQER
jgi:septal ring-binding cell division protein DamX